MAYEFCPKNYQEPYKSLMKVNYEAAEALMENLNYSGMLSEKLIAKVWERVYVSTENVIKKYIDKNEDYKDHNFQNDIKEFQRIFENLAIFSDKFYNILFGLFLTTLTIPDLPEDTWIVDKIPSVKKEESSSDAFLWGRNLAMKYFK